MRSMSGSWRDRESLRFLLPAVVCLVALIPIYVHSHYGHGDIDLYHRYAWAFLTRHSLPWEYPALAIVPFLLALPTVGDYIVVYALSMVVLFVAGYIAIHRFASPRAANLYALYIVLGGAITTLARFDLVPALVTVAALFAASKRRFTPAYLLLALGVLLKLYPLVLLPVVMIEHRRVLHFRGGGLLPAPVLRGAGIFALTVGLGFLAAMAIEPGGWWWPFVILSHRPPEVESIPATLLWLTSFVGASAVPDHSFHSFNLVGPAAGGLAILGTVSLLAGCLFVYWRQYQGRIDAGRAFLAVVCVAIVTSKVLSPQYLVWALPLVAMTEGFSLTWVAICLLTTLVYPVLFELDQLHGLGVPSHYPTSFLGVIAVRNALLLLATWRAAVPRADRQAAVTEDAKPDQIPEYA